VRPVVSLPDAASTPSSQPSSESQGTEDVEASSKNAGKKVSCEAAEETAHPRRPEDEEVVHLEFSLKPKVIGGDDNVGQVGILCYSFMRRRMLMRRRSIYV